jgi:IS1 family transposase
MNKLTTAKRTAIVAALVEGSSVRATARMVGVTKGAVLKLLTDVGAVCAAYHHDHVRNLVTKRIECDEIWAFVGAKRRTTEKDPTVLDRNPDAGDAWTFTAIDADTKLAVSYFVGQRSATAAAEFMRDVASRLATRVQLTTDGFKPYLTAVDYAFGTDVDFATLTKLYGAETGDARRYSPPVCIGCLAHTVSGDPDPAKISTSYVERSNLTMRMGMRRFTRLTNGHSKKLINHAAAVAVLLISLDKRKTELARRKECAERRMVQKCMKRDERRSKVAREVCTATRMSVDVQDPTRPMPQLGKPPTEVFPNESVLYVLKVRVFSPILGALVVAGGRFGRHLTSVRPARGSVARASPIHCSSTVRARQSG